MTPDEFRRLGHMQHAADAEVLDRVTRANVDALLNGDALAIWLKGFISLDHCDHVYEHVRVDPLTPLLVHYTRYDGSADYHTHANVLRVSVDTIDAPACGGGQNTTSSAVLASERAGRFRPAS